MKAWSFFLKDVKPKTPGIAESIVEHAILRAAQLFCNETRAWQVELDPITTVDGELAYDLGLSKADLVRLESATLNGFDYDVWRPDRVMGGTYVFAAPDATTVEFSQPVEAGIPLVLKASVKPSNTATGVEDFIYGRYVAVIAKLAIADLSSDLSKRGEAELDMDRIKTRLWRGNAATRPRARAQFF